MKILLCTPYNITPQVDIGGIAVWAQNIVGYYKNNPSDCQIEVIPFDRRAGANAKASKNIFIRLFLAFRDYYTPIKKTRSELKCSCYDVLHLCTCATLSLFKDLFILKMAKRKGVKSVVHFHFGRIPELAQQNNWEWKLLLRVVKSSDSVITIDEKSYSSITKLGFNNVHYLPNPLSLSIMKQVSEEIATMVREERKICFIGHVIPTKGVFELVEACKKIKNIKLFVLGKYTPDVRNQMDQMANHEDWLVFKGEVNHRQVINELLTTSVFVLPSYTEGFPNVILEAMACGCPIVATYVGAIPEMLNLESNEPCGLCCEPKDVDSLYHNIQYFLGHPDVARQYAERAKNRVNEQYAIPNVWKKLVAIWKG